MEFFVRLKEERERLGLSQEAFGSVGGVQKRAQINYESGERKPDLGYLEGLSKIGVDVLYIITGQRSKPIEDTLSADRKVLLDAYDKAPEAVRNAALAVLLSGGQAPEGVDTSKSRKGRAVLKNRVVVTGNNTGNVAGGDINL